MAPDIRPDKDCMDCGDTGLGTAQVGKLTRRKVERDELGQQLRTRCPTSWMAVRAEVRSVRCAQVSGVEDSCLFSKHSCSSTLPRACWSGQQYVVVCQPTAQSIQSIWGDRSRRLGQPDALDVSNLRSGIERQTLCKDSRQVCSFQVKLAHPD